MTVQDDITLSAQQWTHVRVDGVVYPRVRWNPAVTGIQLGIPWMDDTTLCNDCGVASGQFHWILCDQDYAGGRQLLGCVTEADYLAGPD